MSLRRTALIWMTALLAAVGVAAMLIAYTFARREAGGFLDAQLRQIALNAGEGLPDSSGPAVDHDPEDEFVVAIWDAQGREIHQSAPALNIPRQPAIGFSDVEAIGELWRIYTSSDGQRTVQVAQRWSVREEIAASAAFDSAVPILVVIPMSWLVIGWATSRLLRRLEGLATAVATRSTESDIPIPLSEVPSEVASLVKALNNLTSRLHKALDQQKRFVSDAAHELRTPLAALQIQLEGLPTSDPATAAARREALSNGIGRASRLVDQLLRLARLGRDDAALQNRGVELLTILLASVADHIDLAERGGVDLGIGRHDCAVVAGTDEDLQVLLDNLIGNAVRYTSPGGTVDVSSQLENGCAVVEILDTGCGIPQGAETRIFDRFFRAGPPGTEGTGLGLAIVAGIAQRHGYAVTVANRADGHAGTLARVVLPIREQASLTSVSGRAGRTTL